MAAKRKIALCLEYPLALRGGVSVLVETLLQGIAAQYDLVLVSRDSGQSVADLKATYPIQEHFFWDPLAPTRAASKTLANQLKTAGVDLAHFHFAGNFGWGNRFIGRCPIPFAHAAGIKTVSTIHSFRGLLDGYLGSQRALIAKLGIFPLAYLGKLHVLFHLEREIAVSKANYEKLRRVYWPAGSRFVQIYHSRLRSGDALTDQPNRQPLILNVGHIADVKGQEVLAQAFVRIAPKHPEWNLCLVGDVLEEDTGKRIEALAKAHGLQSRIMLAGPRKDVRELMTQAAIYVQPSRSEALGLALQEALFHGCPAIGSRVGGIPELIQDQKNGLLVEPGNVDQLAEALKKLIQNPVLRENYGRAGSAFVQESGMTREVMIASHLQLYASVLGQG